MAQYEIRITGSSHDFDPYFCQQESSKNEQDCAAPRVDGVEAKDEYNCMFGNIQSFVAGSGRIDDARPIAVSVMVLSISG